MRSAASDEAIRRGVMSLTRDVTRSTTNGNIFTETSAPQRGAPRALARPGDSRLSVRRSLSALLAFALALALTLAISLLARRGCVTFSCRF